MKQILKTPTKVKKAIYLSDNDVQQKNKYHKLRYKQSIQENNHQIRKRVDSNYTSIDKNQNSLQDNKKGIKKVYTQYQNTDGFSLMRRKISGKNERYYYMNTIKNKILSDNKFNLQNSLDQYSQNYQTKTFSMNKYKTHCNFHQQSNKLIKTQPKFQYSIKKVVNHNKDDINRSIKKVVNHNKDDINRSNSYQKNTFKQVESKTQAIGLAFDSQIDHQFKKQQKQNLQKLKQKKICKYIEQFELESQKQLYYLQTIANDKYHKKNGKIGIALSKISQMRIIKHHIVQNLKKSLIQTHKGKQQSNNLILPSLDQIKVVQFLSSQIQKNHHPEQVQVQNYQNALGLSMVQQPPKLTLQQLDNQIQHTVNDFFRDFDLMIQHKKQIYTKFRNQLVYEFPEMLDKYKEYQIRIPDRIFQTQKKIQIKDQKSKLRQTCLNESFCSRSQIQKSKSKQQSLDLSKLFQLIFKRAYFYSKSKNKVIQTKTPLLQQQNTQDKKQQKKIKYSYLTYLKDKCRNTNLKKLKMAKGRMLIKSKQSILTIENEGSKQHQRLKKCLNDAIQDCLKQYDQAKTSKFQTNKKRSQKPAKTHYSQTKIRNNY